MSQIRTEARLFTIGYYDLEIPDMLGILEKSSIKTVADIRSNPASARYPQFERYALAKSLRERGIAYRWFRVLGGIKPRTPQDDEQEGLREPWQRAYASFLNTTEAREVIAELRGLSLSTTVCLFCAETKPQECHRYLICDRLAQEGLSIVHLVMEKENQQHVISEEMTTRQGRVIYEKKQLTLEI